MSAAMTLTVLGKYGTFPPAGGACSGYLLRRGRMSVVMDCGNGTLSRLQRFCRVEEIDAIVVSHLHDDHMGDLRILKYAVETKAALGAMKRKIPLFLPRTPERVFADVNYPAAFDVGVIGEQAPLCIGGLTFTFFRTVHPVETYAIGVSDGRRKLVYSADTAYAPELAAFAKGADLFLCEATTAAGGKVKLPHLTAEEAAALAREAGVGRLLLTHLWCDESEDACRAAAAAIFGRTETAVEGKTYEV